MLQRWSTGCGPLHGPRLMALYACMMMGLMILTRYDLRSIVAVEAKRKVEQ